MTRCEALVATQSAGPKYYKVMFVPCGNDGAELHHKLTRARGGLLLDTFGETYHQIHLCREHHNYAHAHPDSKQGLMIDGWVVTHPDGRPFYTGSDEYLTEKYGPRENCSHCHDDPPKNRMCPVCQKMAV